MSHMSCCVIHVQSPYSLLSQFQGCMLGKTLALVGPFLGCSGVVGSCALPTG